MKNIRIIMEAVVDCTMLAVFAVAFTFICKFITSKYFYNNN